MAHGLPVVTSAGTATEEVAAGAAVLVDPHDSGAVADALRAVLDDGRLRRELSCHGRVRAAELTWEATAEGYADAFGAVL
jgi:glycosyltransferase involved in cell wall biosynthesis